MLKSWHGCWVKCNMKEPRGKIWYWHVMCIMVTNNKLGLLRLLNELHVIVTLSLSISIIILHARIDPHIVIKGEGTTLWHCMSFFLCLTTWPISIYVFHFVNVMYAWSWLNILLKLLLEGWTWWFGHVDVWKCRLYGTC